MDVPRAAEPLLSLPPSRFTAERNALAAALAARGDAAAAAVRRLRRPVGLAWVLNRLARERPREIEALFAAGDRLRAGQRRAVSGAGADELRAADEELRARTRELRSEAERLLQEEGRPPTPTALARLELLLRATAPLPGPSREALRRGVLAREPEIASGELGGLAVVAGGAAGSAGGSAVRRTGGARGGEKETRSAPARARRQEAARAARERRERERLKRQVLRQAKAASARAEREERAATAAAERAARARAEAERLAAKLRELERVR